MKKQKISFQKLALKKQTISALAGQDQVLGGNVPTTSPPQCGVAQTKKCVPLTAAPDICQPSFIVTGCPHPPQTQACPTYPPQCSVNVACVG